MSKHFTRTDYPPKVIRDAFDKVYHLDREQLLNPINSIATNEEEKDNTFLITTFHLKCDGIVQKVGYPGKIQLYPTLIKLNLIKGKSKG